MAGTLTIHMHLTDSKTTSLTKTEDPARLMGDTDNLVANLSKQDKELQIVWGEVYVPNVLDSQGQDLSLEQRDPAKDQDLQAGRLRFIEDFRPRQPHRRRICLASS
ncbi:hypothetical protein A9Q94_07785 [Rhodobacterales bacterium 56_14_T64]|nr:hypothetical protein A9Q94_07785 [Rhodobacterales bacterium 56_14_T64]